MPQAVSLNVLEAVDCDRHRDTSRPILLIGFQRQANLGLGYLSANLKRYGYRVELFDFESDPEQISRAAREMNPLLVGFSLIFQFYVPKFASLAKLLREKGIDSHFTIGGHFPSLSYQKTLELIPELDSVVRFEGESTLLELADSLSIGKDWKNIQGIAYRENGEPITTSLRPLIHDLDQLPYPDRQGHENTILGHRAIPILASRGCARTCSFCSIHMFYRAVPGKVVRTRKPAEVVREMRMLYEERDITIFSFQDDDFPLFGPAWKRWATAFADELHRAELPGRAIWKMNCRADAVDAELFRVLKDAGLHLVYMGLESGTEQGLETLHKQINVQQNIRAVELLKELGLRFEFGFMLFDPSTTFESVQENLQFLRRISGDGSTATSFCRMAPYDGTPIKEALAREGRLRGDVCNPTYDFLDPELGQFYDALRQVVDVSGWIHGHKALSPQLNYCWNEVAVLERLFPQSINIVAYRDPLQQITRESNELLFSAVEETMRSYHDRAAAKKRGQVLRERCDEFLDRLMQGRNAFIREHHEILLDSLRQVRHAERACA